MTNEPMSHPSETIGDHVHAVVRAGLGAIPVAGSAAVELFSALIKPPLEKRRDEWMTLIGEKLLKLEEKGNIVINELQNNDAFIDLLMDASQTVMRNSQLQKRLALQNAVINAALKVDPDESIQHIFIRWIDELTVWHLNLLLLFRDPSAWAAGHNHSLSNYRLGSLATVIVDAFPELRDKRDFYDMIWNDLHQRGLVNTESLHTTMTGDGMFAKRTSDTCDRFLKFISEPAQ